jgi:ElaB/YqjD/DUF883 family membrane-anchored ribosome-binding protein
MIDQVQEIRAGVGAQAEALREQALSLAADAREQITTGAGWVKQFTVRHPAKALGIALGAGVLLGLLIRRH